MSKLHIKLWERDPLGCLTKKFIATCLCKLESSSNSLTQEDLWPTWRCWWCAHTAKSRSWTSTCWRCSRSHGTQIVSAAQSVGSFSMKNASQGMGKYIAKMTFTGNRLSISSLATFTILILTLIAAFQRDHIRFFEFWYPVICTLSKCLILKSFQNWKMNYFLVWFKWSLLVCLETYFLQNIQNKDINKSRDNTLYCKYVLHNWNSFFLQILIWSLNIFLFNIS